ncbi:MAG: hypothetical protein MJB14_12585 [Spirochaetes bacterium]|nr:hypothetical protein [Spirochaetota bacterium]
MCSYLKKTTFRLLCLVIILNTSFSFENNILKLEILSDLIEIEIKDALWEFNDDRVNEVMHIAMESSIITSSLFFDHNDQLYNAIVKDYGDQYIIVKSQKELQIIDPFLVKSIKTQGNYLGFYILTYQEHLLYTGEDNFDFTVNMISKFMGALLWNYNYKVINTYLSWLLDHKNLEYNIVCALICNHNNKILTGYQKLQDNQLQVIKNSEELPNYFMIKKQEIFYSDRKLGELIIYYHYADF